MDAREFIDLIARSVSRQRLVGCSAVQSYVDGQNILLFVRTLSPLSEELLRTTPFTYSSWAFRHILQLTRAAQGVISRRQAIPELSEQSRLAWAILTDSLPRVFLGLGGDDVIHVPQVNYRQSQQKVNSGTSLKDYWYVLLTDPAVPVYSNSGQENSNTLYFRIFHVPERNLTKKDYTQLARLSIGWNYCTVQPADYPVKLGDKARRALLKAQTVVRY